MLFIQQEMLFAQFTFPSDTNYRQGEVIARFHHDIVNPEYFCLHPWPNPGLVKSASGGGGYITPSYDLISDTGVVTYLLANQATLEPMWATCSNPCLADDRIEVTRWGDTLNFPYWTWYVIHFPEALSETMFTFDLVYNNPYKVYAQPFMKVHYTVRGAPNDPLYVSQGSLPPVVLSPTSNYGANIEGAWDYTTGIWDVKMADFDAGFDSSHIDFKHVLGNGTVQTNIVLDTNFISPGSPVSFDAHGLFTSGIMGALRNNKDGGGNYVGVAGVAAGDWENGNKGCRLYLAQVVGASYVKPHINALEALTRAQFCNDRVRVINMSYGNGVEPTTINASGGNFAEYQKFAEVYRRCVVVSNAKMEYEYVHNTDPAPLSYRYDLPGGYNDQWIISVSASRELDGALTNWSAWGGNLRLLAPGTRQHVYGLLASNTYGIDAGYPPNPFYPDAGGTSWAAPHVSGTAALILSRDTTLLNDDVAGLMEATARKVRYYQDQIIDPDSLKLQVAPYDKHTGFGLLDAGEAVRRVPDVQRGYIRLDLLSDEEFQERVQIDTLDSPADSTMLIMPTDIVNDPFQPGGDSIYAVQRLKVTVSGVRVGKSGERLDHAWGIGMGHGFVPNTTGWEEGVVDYPKQFSLYRSRYCSETPYAKVLPETIDPTNRTFSVVTYVYLIHSQKRRAGLTTSTHYPVTPRNVTMSYGYLMSPVSSSVEDAGAVDRFAIAGVYPNPGRVSEGVTVRFTLAKKNDYILHLYDVFGREVMTPVPLGSLEPGTREVPLNLIGLAVGTYFCRIVAADGSEGTGTSFTLIGQ